MDAQTCLKKLQCVGVLNFSTVGLDGTPQARCISAIHYTSDALYFFTARGKEFCRELLHDGQVQILAYTRYKEMIRVSAKAVPVPEAEQKRCIDLIFQEQPYLSNVYPGATREIGIVFVARDIRIEYFHLGVKPIFRETYTLGKGKRTPKGYEITGESSAAGNALRSVRSNALHREHPTASHRSTACIAEIASSSVPYRPSRKKFEVQYEWQRKTAAPARKEGRDNA